jgi:amino acid adenylation domain-containing protein/thioester reductase-like protein
LPSGGTAVVIRYWSSEWIGEMAMGAAVGDVMVSPDDALEAPTILSRTPSFARGDGQVVCREVGRFAAQLTGSSEAMPVIIALVGCVVARYRARDHVRIAVSSAESNDDRRQRADDTLVCELPVAPGARFTELVAIVSQSLKQLSGALSPEDEAGRRIRQTPDAGDTAIDALVVWQEGKRSAGRPSRRIGRDRAEFLLDFSLDSDILRLAVQLAEASGYRTSPLAVAQVFAEIVRGLFEDPSATIDELRFVSSEWRNRLLVEFNGLPVPYRKDRTILDLFETCVARAGDRPAIRFGEDTLSYAALNGKANALAQRVREAGVTKGDLVPVVTGGGVELPIAMIALMKLGVAFVPVDVAWPDERIRVIFNELKPKVALYKDLNQVVVSAVPSLCFVASSLDEQAAAPTAVKILPDDLIYGFFTSGSTGVPKCALNLHGGLLNRFQAMSRRFGADGNDIVLQNSKHVFDSSIWQLLWPLTTGSQIVIPQGTNLLDLSYTVSLIDRHQITMTDFVPSIFNALVDLIEADSSLAGRLASLRQLLIGGEEIGAKAVQKFRRFLPGCGITNTYGPTEASIGCIFHEVSDEDGWSIPIGKPIDNCYAAIVDKHGMIVPPGVTGEILIGGDCLGRGYLHDPTKTAAAFIANPFVEIPGTRLYRTGDLGYHRPDGNIHFVGRQDHQIKLGGVRMELTEIETVIARHAAVRAVKVVVEGARDEAQRLVAYVVANPGTESKALKHVVAEALPGYCVPKHIFLIDRMPLTANGKVDRKALAAMLHRDRGTPADETTSEAERRIKGIWLKLLALDAAGIHDDFFDLGGDSLVAVKLGLLLSRDFGRKVSARDIYRYPTISMQAAFVGRGSEGSQPGAGADVEAALRAAARLDSSIVVGPRSLANTPSLILLTGATGFVGSHVLVELLLHTNARVICLVRAANDAAAAARVRQALQHYRLWEDRHIGRITGVAGDLSQPQFSLSDDEYDRLVRSVDTVVHSGAEVNFLHDYRALHATNVKGTTEIIKFAAARRSKRLHHISTLSAVVVDRGSSGETEISAEAQFPTDGYGQSKAVAERLVSEARRRGLAATTYRLGEVMPHSRTGVPNNRALFDTVIRACLKLGLSFVSPLRLDYTPVDYVARFVASAVAAPMSLPPVFHVFHPEGQALETVFASLRRVGFPLRPVSYRMFHEALRDTFTAAVTDEDLLLTHALMPEPDEPDGSQSDRRVAHVFPDAGERFSCAHALAAAYRWGIAWTSPNPNAIDKYAAFHRRGSLRQAVGMGHSSSFK